jgi:predicted transcriptional regulator
MKPVKSMTIRLSAEQAEALETVATVEDTPISEVIRAAIAQHIDSRKQDPRFQDGLRERIERAQRLLSPNRRG